MPEETAANAYAQLLRELREIAVLASTSATLGWDQETMMPDGGAALRGEQTALLEAMIHERRTAPRFGELLAEAEADPAVAEDPVAAANLREIRRDHERQTRFPTSLVREFAEVTTLAMHAWKAARENSDFAAFAPWLERVVRLNRDRAECLGVPESGEAYDTLLDEYEPGMTTAELTRVFSELREGLAPLIHELVGSGRKPDTSWQNAALAVDRQAAFNRAVVERMGFDFSAGRLDVSTHPFCTGLGAGDTRLTTRYDETQFASALNATMHEAGHGLYEQNLPKADRFGQPLAEAASTGIHESQSRMWENLVGRSRPFWEWALPRMQETFDLPALRALDVETVYRGMNVVEPNLIRIESDEATYNLHIMLRFDLERAMLREELNVADLPAAWAERMRNDLGLEVPDDRRGALQDIHWSMGAIGYFPTYSLGNLYAAQIWDTLRTALPDLDDQLRAGEFLPLRDWLVENVHAHGRRFRAPELCERITGKPLSHEPLLRSLGARLREAYGLA
jgi:carboxypeptidase Taq